MQSGCGSTHFLPILLLILVAVLLLRFCYALYRERCDPPSVNTQPGPNGRVIDNARVFDVPRATALRHSHAWIGWAWPCTYGCGTIHALTFAVHIFAQCLVAAALVETQPTLKDGTANTGLRFLVGVFAAFAAEALRPAVNALFYMYRTVDHRARFARLDGDGSQDLREFGARHHEFVGVAPGSLEQLSGVAFRKRPVDASDAAAGTGTEELPTEQAPDARLSTFDGRFSSVVPEEDDPERVDTAAATGHTAAVIPEAVVRRGPPRLRDLGLDAAKCPPLAIVEKCRASGVAALEVDPRLCVTVDCRGTRFLGLLIATALALVLFWVTFAITAPWCRGEMTVFGHVFAFAVVSDILLWQTVHVALYNLWHWMNAEGDDERDAPAAQFDRYSLHPVHGQHVFVGPPLVGPPDAIAAQPHTATVRCRELAPVEGFAVSKNTLDDEMDV